MRTPREEERLQEATREVDLPWRDQMEGFIEQLAEPAFDSDSLRNKHMRLHTTLLMMLVKQQEEIILLLRELRGGKS